MRIEKASDLIFWTYYMMDWSKVGQARSSKKCAQCGGLMNKVETVTDDSGLIYEGLVCHHCKTVLWVRREGRLR